MSLAVTNFNPRLVVLELFSHGSSHAENGKRGTIFT